MAVSQIHSIQDVLRIWEDLLEICPEDTVYLTPQWQETWWSQFGHDREMAGFYIDGPQGVSGIASLARQGDTVSFVGTPETFDYNDFIIKPGYEREFYVELLNNLETQNVKRLELFSLRETSPTLFHLPDMARSRGYVVEVSEEDVAPGLELPSEWESYMSGLSKKDRHELRRKFRRLESLPEWRWYVVSDPLDLDQHLDEFLRLMRLSATEKSEYMTSENESFFRKITACMAKAGLIKIFFVEIDGVNVASSLCFDYHKSRLLYNSGYDPEYSYYSVGLLMNALCLQDSIEHNLKYFDFLRGSEPYKYHLGGANHDLYSMVVRTS